MFLAELCTALIKWKEPKCPTIGEWMHKMWYISTIQDYLTINRNEVPTHSSTWMAFEDIMLSRRSQSQKTTPTVIPFT